MVPAIPIKQEFLRKGWFEIRYGKLATVLFAVLMITGMGVAAGETLQPEKATTVNDNIQFGEVQNTTFFDRLSLAFLSVTGPDNPNPGETYEFTAEVEAKETFDMNNKIMIVEFYRCVDSGCDDGDSDTFLEAKRDPFNADFTWTIPEGDRVNWDVDYTVPNEEGYYAAVAYVTDRDYNIYTESPKKVFTVGSPGDTTSPEEDLSLYQTPSFTVDEEENTVTGTLGIQNKGGDMPDSDIVEMQVRPYGETPLSFTEDVADTCDEDFPNNVHKEYRLDSGDSREISLTTQGDLQDGEAYTVYFLTREGCSPNNEHVEPIDNSYNAGTVTLDDVSPPETEDPDVVQVSKPTLTAANGTVSTKVHFKNKGGAMQESNIVEMQVRPSGTGPLAFSSTTGVCDPEYPENVHKEFKLGAGESASTTLTTSEIEPDTEYTVYLLTRTGCAPSDRAQPYENSVRAGTFESGSVNPPKPGLPLQLIAALLVAASLVVGGVYLYG